MSQSTEIVSFDYAIKYLLKDKGDYEIVEGFISALFATIGYGAIKIDALLESESNKERPNIKTSVADLIVSDAEGNKHIVEISKEYTKYFLHKACFNTSRLIVDHLSAGGDYLSIKKVFHINILYFQINGITTPLTHGKVIFHKVEQDTPIHLEIIDKQHSQLDIYNLFPEYFIISVPLFNDIIHVEMDEWLYVMKNSAVQASFQSPYMKKVAERLSILKMNPKELQTYYEYQDEIHRMRDCYISAEEKGIKQGIEKGKMEVAKNLLLESVAPKTISIVTGLSIEDIKKL
jgi:predicted transposase/invertase (TIGR01784 family)